MKTIQIKTVKKEIEKCINDIEKCINRPIIFNDGTTYQCTRDFLDYTIWIEGNNKLFLGVDGLLLDIIFNGNSDGCNFRNEQYKFETLFNNANWFQERENYGCITFTKN